jgi:hypothetical protein
MNVSPEIQMLIDRLDTHPEEFISNDLNFVNGGPALTSYNRWGPLTKVLLDPDSQKERDVIFTKEEQEALTHKLSELLRKRLRENILHELVSGERQEKLKLTESEHGPLSTTLQRELGTAYPL